MKSNSKSFNPKHILITGATGTGKTQLAFELAGELHADIINADSRQLYKDLNIITGKDIPISTLKFNKVSEIISDNFRYDIGYYLFQNHKIWLYDLAPIQAPISISLYYQACEQVCNFIGINQSKIIVGGSGLYLDNLIYPKETIFIPQSQSLRSRLEKSSVVELQSQLKVLNPNKYGSMNNSDRNNPYRLIRAIEVATSKTPSERKQSFLPSPIVIGLRGSKNTSAELITHRVEARIKAGAITEVEMILKKYPEFTKLPGYRTLGYSLVIKYLHGLIDHRQLIELWTNAELQYTKRQHTWLAKRKYINWFEIQAKDWYDEVKELISNH